MYIQQKVLQTQVEITWTLYHILKILLASEPQAALRKGQFESRERVGCDRVHHQSNRVSSLVYLRNRLRMLLSRMIMLGVVFLVLAPTVVDCYVGVDGMEQSTCIDLLLYYRHREMY